MNWTIARPWVSTLARLLLGVVWIWAALSKLSNPRDFVQAVRAYDATPEWMARGLGYGLPVLELCLGVVLIIGITVRLSAALSAVLLFVFLIGLVQAAARGLQLSCGCFGAGGATDGATSYSLDIVRDVALLAVAAYLVVWSFSRLSLEEFFARHDVVEMPSAKRMRAPDARRRYDRQVEATERNARVRTWWIQSSVSIVVVLVSIIGIGVQAGRAKIANVVPGAFATASNGIVFGKAAAATVDIYEDFGCPICLQFEQQTHGQLEKDVRANLAQVRYHPISILDRSSPNQYSTRAANAAICVSDTGIEPFVRYHDILYGTDSSGAQVQPKEGTAGPGDAQLTAFAKQAQLSTKQLTTASDCILGQQYKPLILKMTDVASQRGITGTPTIVVNGTTLSGHDGPALFAAIAAADKNGPAPVPSPTASLTPAATGVVGSPSSVVAPSGGSLSSSPSSAVAPSGGSLSSSPSSAVAPSSTRAASKSAAKVTGKASSSAP